MQRVTASGLVVGTVPVVLTCPTGKKYEILDIVINAGFVVNRIAGAQITQVGPVVVALGRKTIAVADDQFPRFSGNAVLLFPTETLSLYVIGGAGAAWSYLVTYMDVDTI